jgi:hypothetical protein
VNSKSESLRTDTAQSIYLARGRRNGGLADGPYTVETKQIETVDNDFGPTMLLGWQSHA